MQNKVHPTHAAKTRWIMLGLFVLAGLAFGLAYYAQEVLLNQNIINYSAVVFAVSIIAMLLMFLLRALISDVQNVKHG